MQQKYQTYRARSCYSMQGEEKAFGKQLFFPLPCIDNALIVVTNGIIQYVGRYDEKYIPVGAQRHKFI